MLSLYETLAPCKEEDMQIKITDFYKCCDIIPGVLARIRNHNKKRARVARFEVQFADLSELPGSKNASLTVKVWRKKSDSEPSLIEHWSFCNGKWSRDE